jgi:hypothetical protein
MPRKVCLIDEKRGSAQNKSDDNGEEGFVARAAPSIKKRMPWAICSPECSDFAFEASDEKENPLQKKERKMKNSASWRGAKANAARDVGATAHARFAITPTRGLPTPHGGIWR